MGWSAVCLLSDKKERRMIGGQDLALKSLESINDDCVESSGFRLLISIYYMSMLDHCSTTIVVGFMHVLLLCVSRVHLGYYDDVSVQSAMYAAIPKPEQLKLF